MNGACTQRLLAQLGRKRKKEKKRGMKTGSETGSAFNKSGPYVYPL